MRLQLIALAVATAAVGWSAPAAATVTYSVSTPTLSTSFTYTAADFLTQDTTVLSGDLDSCTIDSLACSQVTFHVPHDMYPPSIVVEALNDAETLSFYVAASDFSTPGTYAFAVGSGSLTISVSSVPEPATWAMMLLGFGAIGFAARRSGLRKPLSKQLA